MERDLIEINGAIIMQSLFEKYKNKSWVLSSDEIWQKCISWFPGKWGKDGVYLGFGLKSGITFSKYHGVSFLIDAKKFIKCNFNTLKDIRNIFHIHNPTSIKINLRQWDNCYMKMSEPEIQFLQEFLDIFSSKVDERIEYIENMEKLEKENEKTLKKTVNSLLKEFDKDRNGVVDVTEGLDDLMILFKKHQKKIIDVDKQYVQNFVKVSNYLKTRSQNIQDIFSFIKNTKNYDNLYKNVELLENQIHTFELLLFHSLNMIISIVEDDLISFYEIYESFDKLNMFSNNWENEVSQQLRNIEDGLNELIYSIDSIEGSILSGLSKLTYVTQEGFLDLERSVNKELQSIDSSIKFNNLLTGISTYQLYKINKQTKPLLPK